MFNGLVSPYSYFATQYLRKNRAALESHGVDIEYVLYPMQFQFGFANVTDSIRFSWAASMLALV